MITLEMVRKRLDSEGIAYTIQRNVSDEHWAAHVIRITGGPEEAPLRIVFGEAQGEERFIDLRFGRYEYELFSFSEETVMNELVQDIQAVLAGKIRVISAWYTHTQRWRGDACYYVAPGEEDDDSDEYAAALCRLERPKTWLARQLTRRITYAIYDWQTYREIIC